MQTQKAKNYYPASTVRLVLIIIGISGILLRNSLALNDMITNVLFIIQLVALDVILRESNFFITNYYRIVMVCLSIYIVGTLFKIMHWFGADQLLIVATAGVVITYITRTINKTKINILDIVKCGWVVSVCFTSIARLLHLQYAIFGSYINLSLFALMLLLFFLAPVKEQVAIEKEGPEELPFDQVD